VEADKESRSECDSSDWLLDRSVFRNLSSIWPTDTDLYSSHWNAQLLSFVSWRPQPGASAVNAFSLNWSNCAGYAFPHFALIPKSVVSLLLDGNRASTYSTYDSAWRNGVDWCSRRNENPLSVPIASALEFISGLYREGRSYSSLNVHRLCYQRLCLP